MRLPSLLAAALMALAAAPAHATVERIELSAPILPKVLVLYAHEGASFPATLDGETELAANASLGFDQLLEQCPGLIDPVTSAPYRILSAAAGDPPLTSFALAANYDQVAKCAYDQFTSKPYWIPQLVDDVAICETVLGADWHLPTADDVASFGAADFQFFDETLTAVADGTSFWGSFYFSLAIYARDSDGALAKADLGPGVSQRLSALGVDEAKRTSHFEGNLSLRCLRRTLLP
jgi:hypothetical protein